MNMTSLIIGTIAGTLITLLAVHLISTDHQQRKVSKQNFEHYQNSDYSIVDRKS